MVLAYVGFLGAFDDFEGGRPVGREWLLADDSDLVVRRNLHKRKMLIDPRHDVDEIEIFTVKHFCRRTVRSRSDGAGPL